MVGVSAVEVRVRGCLMCLMSVARRLQIEDSEVKAEMGAGVSSVGRRRVVSGVQGGNEAEWRWRPLNGNGI